MSRANQVLSQFKKNKRIQDLDVEEETLREKNLETLDQVMNSLGVAQNRAAELQQALRERANPSSMKSDILENIQKAQQAASRIDEGSSE